MFSFRSIRGAEQSLDVDSTRSSMISTRRCVAMEAAPRDRTEDKSRSRLLDTPDSTPSSPVSIPSRNSSRSSSPATMRTSMPATRKHDAASKPRRPHSVRSDNVAPSVAAMLAMTAIPSRNNPRKRPSARSRRISIEELVQEWRTEAQSMPSNASHKSLEVLLEPSNVNFPESLASSLEGYPITCLSSRSSSSDSIPSLDIDQGSLISLANPPTPDSPLNSRPASINTARKSKQRPSLPAQDCAGDHPLLPQSKSSSTLASDDSETMSFSSSPKSSIRRKSTFKSNITSSLASLKDRALSSISQFSLSTIGPNPSYNPYAFSDATLWQHPHIFPRIGPEIRPEYDNDPSDSQRRYFNPPTPLTFEELEARYREALHPAFPGEAAHKAMIQMRTYSRPRVGKRTKSAPAAVPVPAPDPSSEAGRALAAPPVVVGVKPRAREPRENADFLRVVVLEMNMRRVGKLEDSVAGRARIWLPPRQGYAATDPGRWRAVCVDEL